MSHDPFAPPEDPQVELSLDRPAVVPGTAAPELPIPRAPRPKPRARRPSSTPWVVWALAALGGIALFGMVTRALKQAVEGQTAQRQTATPAPPPAVARVPTWKPVETGEGVLIDVRLVPRAARLFVDGAPAPSNPLRLPRGSTRHELSATAEGYETAHRVITAEQAQTIELRLAKRAP